MPTHKRYQKNPSKHCKESSQYYYKNRDKVLDKQKLYYLNHPEKKKETDKRFYEKHKNSEKYIKEVRERHKKYRNSLLGKYRQYKFGAKGRKYNFDLTMENFRDLWGKPCYYCGDPIESIGLDRKDNSIGYVGENVVPCCSVCNYMKRTMSLDEFVGHCLKIIINGKKKYVK